MSNQSMHDAKVFMGVSQALLDKLARVSDVPTRLLDAFVKQQELNQQGIYFAPVRHHSPACAYALSAWIEALKPSHILIEAPQSFVGLVEDLGSTETVPPIAIFAQARQKSASKAKKATDEETDEAVPQRLRSAYFPFCEYSPEWVAIQTGRALGAKIGFIDLDWASQCAQEDNHHQHDAIYEQKNLMAERYLAHSDFIAKLARALHCRHHDELWAHLFELQPITRLQTPAHFFADVLAWCALARLDYEEAVLLAEGSLHREYCMYQHIVKAREQNVGNMLVVTGGFHTLALIENVSAHLAGCEPKKYQLAKKDIGYEEDAWLIRYSFDRLDALSGYASGMPSPAYYQWWWDSLSKNTLDTQQEDEDKICLADLHYIGQLCHQLHAKGCLEVTAFIAFKGVMEVAQGLANLRGHYRPSRDDLLDALKTVLIKGEMDDGQAFFWQVVDEFLSGTTLGKVPKRTKSPALVQYVYERAVAFRFKLDDTTYKTRKLDVYRKPLHHQISQFLHVLEFLGVGFANRLSGPDFVSGASMELLFEEWRYAWTPSVEARLIELSEQGDSLTTLAVIKIGNLQAEHEKAGFAKASVKVAELLALACRLGLKTQLTYFLDTLKNYLHHDQSLSSVVGACQKLFYLWQWRQLLALPKQAFEDTILLATTQALYLMDTLYDDREEVIDSNVDLLKELYHLLRQIQDKFALEDTLIDKLYQALDIARMDELRLFKLRGASDALMFLDSRLSQQAFQEAIAKIFAQGCPADDAVAYLQGMFGVAPEVFVQSSTAIFALHQQLSGWSDEYFLQVLPDLRFMFSQLTPRQSERVADTIATLTGLAPEELQQVMVDISEEDMLAASQLNHQMQTVLANDGLLGLFGR